MRFLLWEIRVAFPGESQLWQSRATQPRVHAGCFSVSIMTIHRTLTWTSESLMCAQIWMRAIVHGGVQTPFESLHWKLTLGEKSLAAPGNRTCNGGMLIQHFTTWATTPPAAIQKWIIDGCVFQFIIMVLSWECLHYNRMEIDGRNTGEMIKSWWAVFLRFGAGPPLSLWL